MLISSSDIITGKELFYRSYCVDFEPATELTITSIPSQAKISYDFGESTGSPAKISFRSDGGLIEDIVQRFCIDPLPSFISFDLTLLGEKEFIYESDSSYDVSYSLDSNQKGNLVTFKTLDLPERVHASCGVDLGVVCAGFFSAFAGGAIFSGLPSICNKNVKGPIPI